MVQTTHLVVISLLAAAVIAAPVKSTSSIEEGVASATTDVAAREAFNISCMKHPKLCSKPSDWSKRSDLTDEEISARRELNAACLEDPKLCVPSPEKKRDDLADDHISASELEDLLDGNVASRAPKSIMTYQQLLEVLHHIHPKRDNGHAVSRTPKSTMTYQQPLELLHHIHSKRDELDSTQLQQLESAFDLLLPGQSDDIDTRDPTGHDTLHFWKSSLGPSPLNSARSYAETVGFEGKQELSPQWLGVSPDVLADVEDMVNRE
ncbi:hypothetical protein AMS68_002142 [Peltaster fructicola]|uniref:Uncharacterized protein n=1 Tax=Peltaster fructicola TaxID=286661 RepID=A0A6H0XPR5_9PEZI|nr:hypothetical protein AMS68_002142 [Peltaster fructicola]